MQTDLTDITQVTSGIIVHQVNCQNRMGSGVAKALFEKWPEVKLKYHEFAGPFEQQNRKAELLGKIQVIRVEPGIFVCNLFGQLNFGRDPKRLYTSYPSVRKGMRSLAEWHKSLNSTLPIYYPKLGCGLANGDWRTVHNIINEELNGLNHFYVNNEGQ